MPKLSPQQWLAVILICTAVFAPALAWKYFKPAARINRAVRAGDLSAVSRLLRHYPELLESRDARQQATPLQWAVVAGRRDIVEFLLQQGADVNACDRSEMTPLHSAAIFNRADIIPLLVQAGAELDAMCRAYGALYLAPLHKAAEVGAVSAAAALIEAGADVNVQTEGANRVTPLHIAAARGHMGIIRLLVEQGAEVNPRDITGATPLRWAERMGQLDAAALLRLCGGRI